MNCNIRLWMGDKDTSLSLIQQSSTIHTRPYKLYLCTRKYKSKPMSLEATINEDLKNAMKAKDQVSLRGIRAIKSAILLYNTSGATGELDTEKEIALLQKLVKQRQDSLDIFVKQGREDLASIEREEIEVIMRYLPKQLSEDELKETIQSIMNRIGATTMKDMGKVMAEASKELAGKADGKAISAVVKALLS